ncbi:hypothetical protein ACIO6T_44630 [Streptomyces sp. NPDC087532]|uniref:hypothetical protein n=1 Tax=Streptomyces sp. NPDC087532 TaxID=3365795 RepID=UPI003815785E
MTRPTRPHSDSGRPAATTWWFVETRSGTQMLTLCPDSSYAPVDVWENGYLVPVRHRERCTPAQRPDVRREVVPDFSAHRASCPVPAWHAVWELRLHQEAPVRRQPHPLRLVAA